MTSTPETSDLEALLAPIPGPDPAGAELRYAPIYDRIRAARRAADDKQQGKSASGGEDDKLSPEERASAAREYWLAVQSLIRDVLASQSKDLQLAVWLLEAEAYINGFTGAANVFGLIKRLLETYWDTFHPPVEEDDEPLALRAGVMEWLNDRLPLIFKSIPLSSGARKYSLADYELTQRTTDEASKAELIAAGRPSPEQFAQAMSSSSAEHLGAMAGQVDTCLAQLIELESVTDLRFATHVVSFGAVRKALEDCQFQVGRALRAK